MSSLRTYDVQVEPERNRIELRFCGNVTEPDARACLENALTALPQLRNGFTVVTDLSALESMTLDCAPHLAKAMDAFRARGVATVVRIIPDPSKDIGFNILAIVHYRRGIRIVTCHDRIEAERALAGRPK